MGSQEELSFEEAFRALYNTVRMHCCCYMDGDTYAADTITSDTFIDLHKKWHTLPTHTAQGLKAWLYRAAHYNALSYCKKQERNPLYYNIEAYAEENPDFHAAHFSEEPFPLAEYEKYKEELASIQHLLSKSEWLLFEYIVIKGCDLRTTAKACHISYDYVRVRWFRIRRKIQKELGYLWKI